MATKTMKSEATKMGRPREFCEEAALDAAMRVFWEKGYEGASLDDLTTAMGINRSSLYASLGDKEKLFQKVLERYGSGPMAYMQEALNKQTARLAIEALLKDSVKLLSDGTHPRGCLTLQAGLSCGTGAEGAKEAALAYRQRGLAMLQRRFQRAAVEGDLPKKVNPKDLARYVIMLLNGLSVQAVNGASTAELNRAADFALRCLPLK